MSVKAQSLVWELPCPSDINGIGFRPSHKYVLIAYSDHADHQGRNMYPAVPTVSRKTGFPDRTVQRLTRDLEEMGLLVYDGKGPRGTNKWRLPYNERGDTVSPVTVSQGDSGDKSLGDSGGQSLGDSPSPELNLNRLINTLDKESDIFKPIYKDKNLVQIWEMLKEQIKRDSDAATYNRVRDVMPYRMEENTFYFLSSTEGDAEWLNERMNIVVARMLVGYNLENINVLFLSLQEVKNERPE